MIAIGQGRLKLNHKYATDGVIIFDVISPYLKHKMERNKRDNSIIGKWLAVNDKIIWFKKGDKYAL